MAPSDSSKDKIRQGILSSTGKTAPTPKPQGISSVKSPPPPIVERTRSNLILELSVDELEDYYTDETKTKVLANEARECIRRLNEISERLSNRNIQLELTKSGYGS